MSRKVVVLYGGTSCEREISLISGKAVFEALVSLGWPVTLVDAAQETFLEQIRQSGCDVVFLALHGTFGEDGQIQRILDQERIIYTGCGQSSSRAAFDKSQTQKILATKGLPIAQNLIWDELEAMDSQHAIGYPCVVKPCEAGSSVGVSIVHGADDFEDACNLAWRYSSKIMIEAFIPGREITVGILDDKPMTPIEVIPGEKFYDYKAKYQSAQTQYLCPAPLNECDMAICRDIALQAYHALECQVLARVDLILSASGAPYILEINTLPGMTSKSLLPKAAKAQGLQFADLCVKIIELSLNKKNSAKIMATK